MTPEAIDAVLRDFRGWLDEFRGAAEAVPASTPAAPAEVDLFALVAQFVALRHEVNMQTKAARAAIEANAETLRKWESLGEAEPETSDNELRPLLKALLDVADILALAAGQIEKLRGSIEATLSDLEATPAPPLDEIERLIQAVDQRSPQKWWRRWLGGPRRSTALIPAADTARLTWWLVACRRTAKDGSTPHVATLRKQFAGLADGYAMSLRKLERLLPTFGLERVPCQGEPFDPDSMEAVEVVAAEDVPSGTVVEELRGGYRWRGRVFRYALVKVAS